MKFLNVMIVLMLISCSYANVKTEPQQGQLKGRVCDLFGQSIPNATVSLALENKESINETSSNARGEFELMVPKSGKYVVVVSKQGFQQQRRNVQFEKSEIIELNFGLEIGDLHNPFRTRLAGIVTTTSGSKLQGVSVTIQSIFNPFLKEVTITNAEGEYELSVKNSGHYIIIATGSDFVAEVIAVTILPSLPRKNRKIDLVLRRVTEL